MNGDIFLISIFLPFFMLLLFKAEGKIADSIAATITGISLLINGYGFYLFFQGDLGKIHHYTYLTAGKLGEVFGLNVGMASVLIGFISILTGFLLVLYAISYMSPSNKQFPIKKGKGKFYALFGLLMGSTMAFIYSTNLVQFLVFIELMAIATYFLTNFHGNAKGKALKGFLVLNLSVFLLLVTIIFLGGNQSLANMNSLSLSTKNTAFLLLIFASFAMSSQLFFYSWLPDTTMGPVPASAYIHGVSIAPLGAFMLFRVIQYMNPGSSEFWVIGALTVALILLMMIYYPIEKDAKRLIAYSTIAQIGIAYLSLAYALAGHQAGLQIAVYQILNHALVKVLAFMSVGAFAYGLGTTEFNKIKGIRYSLPWASVSWFMSFFGLAGVLPLGIFFSKAFTVMVTHHAIGVASWLFPMIVLIDAATFLIVVLIWFRKIFFEEPHPTSAIKTPKLMNAMMTVVILIGIVLPWLTFNLIDKIGFMGVI